MRQEYGRSLIEILGVLAITAAMSSAAILSYHQYHTKAVRETAVNQIQDIVKNVKLLNGPRGSYEGVSVEYLIKSGALSSGAAPLGGDDWSVTSSDGESFSINLTQLSSADCAYFSIKQLRGVDTVKVNGYELDEVSHCFSTKENQISFIAK